jgi:uncharacterized coiled-coil protein SlyX
MEGMEGRVTNRARIFDEELGKALVKHARRVAQLQNQRRKLRTKLRGVEHDLRTAKKFLKALVNERHEPVQAPKRARKD